MPKNLPCMSSAAMRILNMKGATEMKYPYPPAGGHGEFSTADLMNTSSADDCTGLIPANIDEQEYINYNELYDFLPKAIKTENSTENFPK